MRWAGHVARIWERRGVNRVLVGKPEGTRPLGSRAVGFGCMESRLGEHYRQIFQEMLHKQCFGRIRR
jgi:hypothetical protein